MPENKVYTAIGLMSGTSLDAVDAALIETDGLDYVRPLAFLTQPYEDAVRTQIRAAYGHSDRTAQAVLAAEALSTQEHIKAIKALLAQTGRMADSIDVIGYHGQTIYHAPHDGITVQIGDGAEMARASGIAIVNDFRSADVAAGGEGAPLAPLYHRARLCAADIELPAVILNIGGVGNVTYIDDDEGRIVAFDTGPGNALMDDWMQSRTGARYDEDGKMALAGTPIESLLDEWLQHAYFTRKPPKSLDRDQWDIAALGQVSKEMGAISTEDGAATLLELSARTIIQSQDFMPDTPKGWYACGGGRHNKALMARLSRDLAGVQTVEALGWDGDATEAECFAYLAVRSLKGLPISVPGTTGVPQPMTGGVFHKRQNDDH